MDKMRSTLFPGAGGTDSESADGIPWWMKYLCKIAAILAASGFYIPLLTIDHIQGSKSYFSLDVFRCLELHHDLSDVSDRRGVADHGRLHHDRHRGAILLHVSRLRRLIRRDGGEQGALAESRPVHEVSHDSRVEWSYYLYYANAMCICVS